MHDELYRKLKAVARGRETIHYGNIAPMLALDMENPADRVRVGEILGEISREEHETGHPMLSAVVTHKEDERPGAGFFELAAELGLLVGMDTETFFIRELKKVHDYWAGQ